MRMVKQPEPNIIKIPPYQACQLETFAVLPYFIQQNPADYG